MKWRCEHCGKPHERNDPPCDNCGHSEFEKAVVPMAPEATDEESTRTYAWICTECGNDHPKHTPPCDRCGNATLERRELSYDEDEIVEEMLDESSGRANSADVGYLEVLDAKLILLFLGVAALIAYLALGFLGVVTIPGITPTPPAPGNATAANGFAFVDVESAYLDTLNARRAEEGYANLTVNENLDAAATSYNQQRVRIDYGNAEEIDEDEVRNRIGDACGDARPAVVGLPANVRLDEITVDSERQLGRLLAVPANESGASFVEAEAGLVGVDLHAAPDGTLYLTQIVC